MNYGADTAEFLGLHWLKFLQIC